MILHLQTRREFILPLNGAAGDNVVGVKVLVMTIVAFMPGGDETITFVYFDGKGHNGLTISRKDILLFTVSEGDKEIYTFKG